MGQCFIAVAMVANSVCWQRRTCRAIRSSRLGFQGLCAPTRILPGQIGVAPNQNRWECLDSGVSRVGP